jgi:hypothetical protein
MTGLTEQEFTALLSPFEHALAAYMQDRTIDGQPRMTTATRVSWCACASDVADGYPLHPADPVLSTPIQAAFIC